MMTCRWGHWYRLYQEDGIEGLAGFGHEGGICQLTEDQQDNLKAWITATLSRSTREVGAWIAREFGIEYQSRSGLIALLHRLGMEHRKPKAISRRLEPERQKAFIEQPDRTIMGPDAQARHAQQMLRLVPGIQHRYTEIPS